MGSQNLKRAYPLIEIIGPIDVGKRYISRLIAGKVGATYVDFPILNTSSITGGILLSAITGSPGSLERNPNWWAHIYSAHLYEYETHIRQLLKTRPVLVSNYVLSFRFWNSATKANLSHFKTSAYFSDLPHPTSAYMLIGAKEWESPGNVPLNVSEFFKYRLRTNMAKSLDDKIRKVIIGEESQTHTMLNNISDTITKDICKRNKLSSNPFLYYKPDLSMSM